MLLSMKNPYKNEHLSARVKDNMVGLRFLIVMELLGIFLCSLSFFNTYRAIYMNNEIRFTDLLGMLDDTIYTVEITEMPEELYPSFYMVKMGDNALLVTGIDGALEKFRQTGRVKVRGQLHAFKDGEADIKKAAREYYSRHCYYMGETKILNRAAGHYLKRSDYSFMGILCDDHPLGLVFGLTVLFINGLFMHWQGTLYVIRHLHPACGSVRYTPQEIDEQAERPGSQWHKAAGLYFTPEVLIGTQKGMRAVRYDDIEKIYTRKRTHINWESSPKSSRIRSSAKRSAEILIWASSENSEYTAYQLVVECKNHRKLIMCEITYFEQALIDIIREKCGDFDPMNENTEDDFKGGEKI